MSFPIGAHPAGSAGLCPDTMLLPPQAAGRRLRCQLDAGHDHFHAARDPDNPQLVRRWPRTSTDPKLQSARAASGATVTPIR
jgi:hypothetical protein